MSAKLTAALGASLRNCAEAIFKLGWRATATGDVVELARCRACFGALPIRVMADASICAGCHRVVTGDSDDPKACADCDGISEVLCRACARRLHGICANPLKKGVFHDDPQNTRTTCTCAAIGVIYPAEQRWFAAGDDLRAGTDRAFCSSRSKAHADAGRVISHRRGQKRPTDPR